MRPYKLKKKNIIAKNEQFRAVIAHRHRFTDGFLVLYIAPNKCSFPRLGVSIGKSYGNAVRRNRLKRLIREAFRLNQHNIPPACDYVFTVSSPRKRKKSAPSTLDISPKTVKLADIKQRFESLVTRAEKKMKRI